MGLPYFRAVRLIPRIVAFLEEVSINICMLKDLESLPYGFYTGRSVTWTHRDGDTSMRIEGTEME